MLTSKKALVLLCLLPGLRATPQSRDVVVASTTSTRDTGLLDSLLPIFTARTGYRVQLLAVGTGQALTMGRRGDADVVLVHAPEAERVLVDSGYFVRRRLVMHNEFLIVGPAADPAGLRGMPDAAAALLRLAERRAVFGSRGGQSGNSARRDSAARCSSLTPGRSINGDRRSLPSSASDCEPVSPGPFPRAGPADPDARAATRRIRQCPANVAARYPHVDHQPRPPDGPGHARAVRGAPGAGRFRGHRLCPRGHGARDPAHRRLHRARTAGYDRRDGRTRIAPSARRGPIPHTILARVPHPVFPPSDRESLSADRPPHHATRHRHAGAARGGASGDVHGGGGQWRGLEPAHEPGWP